jgi:hypothetical protein
MLRSGHPKFCEKSIDFRNVSKSAHVVLWILATITAALAAVLYRFDPDKCSFYPICLFHSTTGLLCPGCGSLRALHQLLHGNIVAAFRFNPLLVLGPVVACLSAIVLINRRQPVSPSTAIPPKMLWLFLGIGLAFSIWRNIPGSLLATLPR